MANKKVYYYTFEVRDNEERRMLQAAEVRNLFNNIFDSYCVRNEGISHLALNPNESVLERVTMDIIDNDCTYLFGRIGKFKDNSEALVRNFNTFEVSTVGDEERFLEIYTYFILDYTYGVIGYINGKSAPKAFSLEGIVSLHGERYKMRVGNIVSAETVRALSTPGATIGKIEYSYRIPDIRLLTHLGLTRDAIASLEETDYQTVDISIKNSNRKSLTGQVATIARLIDSFSINRNIDNKKFKGKIPNTSPQKYGFEIENYSTNVDVPTTRVENGNLVRFTLEEIAEQATTRLRTSYLANRRHILRFANIQE